MTTIFTSTPNSDPGGQAGTSLRNEITTSGASLGQLRITIQAGSGAALTAAHVSIGAANTAPNTVATPVEFLFSGSSGFSIAANGTIVSDWVNFSSASTDLVAVIDITTGDIEVQSGLGAGINDFYKASTSSYNQSTVSGFGSVAGQTWVALLETQAGGAPVRTPTLTLLGVG